MIVRRYHESIRAILLKDWDPIGAAEVPQAQDEYDNYVGEIHVMLIRHEARTPWRIIFGESKRSTWAWVATEDTRRQLPTDLSGCEMTWNRESAEIVGSCATAQSARISPPVRRSSPLRDEIIKAASNEMFLCECPAGT